MINVIKEELEIEKKLKKKIKFICKYSNVKPIIIKGSIRKIDKSNLMYIEPHRIIIKNTTFFVFNYSTNIYISNLSKKIKLSELENCIRYLVLLSHFFGKKEV